ncbi:diguanylate cyclase [Zavarzinia aquatilis]|uniref:diguanylate cyclase n=1 Tax=Zavarzinia aquatilis TaxID=2211142 RepID=A0A317EGS6_9PROT|nr:diguanylate cyclase [Zavarzinia aquatilis]PWR25971.1 diguanylate cyclase [Zavarzinia aquatilis]
MGALALFLTPWRRLVPIFLFTLLGATAVQADQGRATAFERAHAEHLGVVRFCVDPDWQPFEWVDGEGRHRGIGADLLALVARRAGLTLVLQPTKDWDDSLAAAADGRCRLLSFLNRTPDRESWLLFTEPVFSDPNVVITREEHAAVTDLHALAGQTMALPRGTSIEEKVRRDYPEIAIVLTATEDEAMQMVSERRADMTLRSLIVAAYTIKKQGLFNLKIAGRLPDYTNQLRIAVSGGDHVLRDILDRGVATLTEEDRDGIVNRYVSIRVEQSSEIGFMLRIGAAALGALLVAGVVIWRMSRLNRELARLSRTDALTGLVNRKAIDARLETEVARALRQKRKLAVVMMDIDHFKAVNDDFGHPAGDRVLTGFGRLIAASVRRADLAGRMGGEEFVVICPDTGVDEAVGAAERIRKHMEGMEFGLGRPVTVSAGVAVLRRGESAQALLARADVALYGAKHAGRNRTKADPV